MLFFPYKADVQLNRLPVLTLIVCFVCIFVFARQVISDNAYNNAVQQYCTQLSSDERSLMRYLVVPAGDSYCDVLIRIRKSTDPEEDIKGLAKNTKPANFYKTREGDVNYIIDTLTSSSQRFKASVPRNLTDKLQFDPNNVSLLTSLTSAFSHGDTSHLVFNLIFFFAFAASVEVITGSIYYLVLFLLCAIGSDYAYAYSVRDLEVALPSIGLSGVVMAMISFLATVKPDLYIRCFFWFFVFVRRFSVPALALAVFYIGKNVYEYASVDADNHINYVAHLSGAAIGFILGLVYRWRNSDQLSTLG
jgi:membrane associated rhomboid family serine protease